MIKVEKGLDSQWPSVSIYTNLHMHYDLHLRVTEAEMKLGNTVFINWMHDMKIKLNSKKAKINENAWYNFITVNVQYHYICHEDYFTAKMIFVIFLRN